MGNYVPTNIKNLDITNMSMQELEELLYRFSLKEFLKSYDKEGIKPMIGENSFGVDKEPSIFFSKGLEACLELWDVWLKWRLNRQNNPMHRGITQEEKEINKERYLNGEITEDEKKEWYHWIDSYRNMHFLDKKDLLKNLYDYQLNEMQNSDYLTLDLIEGEDYINEQIDHKKDAPLKAGRYDKMQEVMYGKYSDLTTNIVDKWNMQTIPGKDVVIDPSRLKRVYANGKNDVYSIVRFMYDKYKKEVPVEKQVKFDMLDSFMRYSNNKINGFADNNLQNEISNSAKKYLNIIKNEYGAYFDSEKMQFFDKLMNSNCVKIESDNKEYMKNQIEEINKMDLTDEQKQNEIKAANETFAHGGRVFGDDTIHLYPSVLIEKNPNITSEEIKKRCNEVLVHELLHFFIRPDNIVVNNETFKNINRDTTEGLVDMCARDIHMKYGINSEYNSNYSKNVIFLREALSNIPSNDERMKLVFNGSIRDIYTNTTTENYNSLENYVASKNKQTQFDITISNIASIVSPGNKNSVERFLYNMSANEENKINAMSSISNVGYKMIPDKMDAVNLVMANYSKHEEESKLTKTDNNVKKLVKNNQTPKPTNGFISILGLIIGTILSTFGILYLISLFV